MHIASNEADGYGGVRAIGYVINKTEEEIRELLELSADMEHDPENPPQFVGSGQWTRSIIDGFIDYYVRVGCWCSHDCCGHLCSLSYRLEPEADGVIKVIVDKGYNY